VKLGEYVTACLSGKSIPLKNSSRFITSCGTVDVYFTIKLPDFKLVWKNLYPKEKPNIGKVDKSLTYSL